jgi:hypothetical protein
VWTQSVWTQTVWTQSVRTQSVRTQSVRTQSLWTESFEKIFQDLCSPQGKRMPIAFGDLCLESKLCSSKVSCWMAHQCALPVRGCDFSKLESDLQWFQHCKSVVEPRVGE